MVVQMCYFTSQIDGSWREYPACDGLMEHSDRNERVYITECNDDRLDIGIVNGRAPFRVRTTQSDDLLDPNDLPF